MILSQLIANSLIIGSIYALVAAGFSLIYATNKFMHLAQGGSVVAAGYLLYAFFSLWHLPFFLACILTIGFTSLLGMAMHRAIYLPMQKRKSSNVILLLASVALLILVENMVLLFFGADVKAIGLISVAKGLSLLGAIITPLQLIIILCSLLIFLVLYFLMKHTKLGMQMRAVADQKELAMVMGINQIRIADYSFLIGSAIAGIAGILISLEQNLEPTMGTGLIIKGFTGAVIGGMSSVPGAVFGSFMLGFAENFGIWFLPSGYKDAIAFALLFLFLLFKPNGLFSRGDKP